MITAFFLWSSKGSAKPQNSNEFYILPAVENNNITCEDGNLQSLQKSPKEDRKLSAVTARLDRNMSLLSNFIIKNDENNVKLPHMKPAVRYNSSEKLKTQVQQLSAFKRPPKKKKNNDPAEMDRQKASVVEDLLGFIKKEEEIVDLSAPTDTILFCGPEKISLIHLKSLYLNLPDQEVNLYKKCDPIFKVGWLSSSIINAFFFKLSMNYQDVFLMSSDLAIRACNRISSVTCLQRHLTSQMRVIFLPANINDVHWILTTIALKGGKLIYYDPLQTFVSAKGFMLLSQLESDLEALFPAIMWEINVVLMQKQTDSINCGPNICHFGYHIAKLPIRV
ncbi:Ubiquitin-like-specific protease 1 [Frankliniella fusca]|uniref:Ubiquitin-like-specific protease 1 n=1 Tax=Frankliniella fusca TaxID=407009 RepID=A0AAE1HMS6_9NEOP|nr:Ubiquitin-like-specific protease 1 [Frankliniella fusca]